MERAGPLLGPAILLLALGLAPALGYATTFVVLALAAVGTLVLVAAPSTAFGGPPPPSSTGEDQRGAPPAPQQVLPRVAGEGDQLSWWRGRPSTPSLLFALAFLLITASSLFTLRAPGDLLPLFGFSALLFHGPLSRLLGGASLVRYALIGAAAGLAAALFYRFALGMPRAAEGFWLIDPYRLATATLLAAFLGLGALFDRPRSGAVWLSLLGLAAALAVIVLTGSRTALLGLPVLLLVTGLGLARSRTAMIAVLVVTMLIAGAALFVELPGTARIRLWDVLATIAGGGRVADPAIDIRLGLHAAALQLFTQSPLVGHGWSEAVMPAVLAHLRPDQLSWGRVVHLHDDVAQFAVSGGLLGLAAWLLMFTAPIAGWLRLPVAERTPQRRHALAVLLTGALVLGVPDTYLAAPMTLTIYVVLLAAITGRTP